MSKKKPSARRKSSQKRAPRKYGFLIAKIADPAKAPSWFPHGELLVRWDQNGVVGYEEWNGTLAGIAYEEWKQANRKLPDSAFDVRPLQSQSRRTRDTAFAVLESILDGFTEIAPSGFEFQYALQVYEPSNPRGIYRVKLEVVTETLHRIVDVIEVEKV